MRQEVLLCNQLLILENLAFTRHSVKVTKLSDHISAKQVVVHTDSCVTVTRVRREGIAIGNGVSHERLSRTCGIIAIVESTTNRRNLSFLFLPAFLIQVDVTIRCMRVTVLHSD